MYCGAMWLKFATGVYSVHMALIACSGRPICKASNDAGCVYMPESAQ